MGRILRRPVCPACLRPQAACICRWIAPVGASVELLILQHPLEVANAKGSARLLHLSLAGSKLVAGEAFDPAELHALLTGGGRTPLLLYPDTPGDKSLGIPAPPPLDPALLQVPSALRLVVLDGTWRKSRKMLYLNPLLQSLPRLALEGMPASHYRIRKAHAPDQLSTLEAATYALMRLEGMQAPFEPLLAAFDGFVGQQAAYSPRAGVPAGAAKSEDIDHRTDAGADDRTSLGIAGNGANAGADGRTFSRRTSGQRAGEDDDED